MFPFHVPPIRWFSRSSGKTPTTGVPVGRGRWHYRLLGLGLLLMGGCAVASTSALPGEHLTRQGQLVFHTDFELPHDHALVQDLILRRRELTNLLGVEPSEDVIHIYLFPGKDEFREYITRKHPDFPDRRALFVREPKRLSVYAAWNPRVGEDLRHEVTHGYLHSVVPGLPLWLDEGIAEFFEAPRGTRGLNASHVYLLSQKLERGDWHPDLERLEQVQDPARMTRVDYAEAWLWTHFLLTDPEANRRPLIQAHLQQRIQQGDAFRISAGVTRELPHADQQIVQHLQKIRSIDSLGRQSTWQ